MRIISAGEILWDIFPDAEHLGGAPFNFAVHAHRLGHEVIFASAVGDDELGRRALARMADLGLSTKFVRVIPDQPTGTVTVTFIDGEPDFVIHRPAAYDFLEIPAIEAEWIYYGTLAPHRAMDRSLWSRLILPFQRRFYDMNLRRDSYSRALVDELMRAADVVKMNERELAFTGRTLRQLRDEYHLQACCVTRSERGCAILVGDDYAEVAAHPTDPVDPVGAGDAFAAAFLHGLNQGWPAAGIGDFANALGALVVSRPGAIPDWSPDELG